MPTRASAPLVVPAMGYSLLGPLREFFRRKVKSEGLRGMKAYLPEEVQKEQEERKGGKV